MHYSHRLSSGRLAQIVGTFVLIPVLILAVAGFWMSKTEHLFEPKYELLASLSKSYGLEPGAPVVVSGIRIGRVKQVDLNDRGTVDLLLQLSTRYQDMVRSNSELRITKSGVVVVKGLRDGLTRKISSILASMDREAQEALINALRKVSEFASEITIGQGSLVRRHAAQLVIQ